MYKLLNDISVKIHSVPYGNELKWNENLKNIYKMTIHPAIFKEFPGFIF